MSFSQATFCFLLVISTFYQANSQNISIIRGERDIFTKLNNCNVSKAECLSVNCTYCQCGIAHSFVRTRGSYGECVPNEFLVSVMSYNSSFLVQDTTDKRCLYYWKQRGYRYAQLRNSICKTTEISQRWLWTNTGQFLNLDLLQCVTVGAKQYDRRKRLYYNLILSKCNKNKQLWNCQGYLHYVYFYFVSSYAYVLSYKNRWFARKWKRYGSNQNLCSQAVGSETFQGGSSLLILNQTISSCQHKSECLSEKEIDVGLKNVTKCFLLPNQTQYINDDEWKPLSPEKESFDVFSRENKVFLKWDLTKTPKSWKGLIVKVQFRCKSSTQDRNAERIRCVLIKYTGSFTGFEGLDENDHDKQSEKKEKPQATVIIVCVLVVAIIIGVIIFLAYRNKNRLINFLAKTKGAGKTENSSPVQKSGASTNPIYHSSNTQSAQNQCDLYESASPEPVYQDSNAGHKTEAQPEPTLTYDYASPGDHLGIGQRTAEGNDIHQNESELENTVHAPPVYHVLESN